MMKHSGVKEFSVSEYRKTMKLEYRIYFTLIFIISIPLAVFSWTLHLVLKGFRDGTEINEGILKRAWGQAQVITPMIFTA